MTRRRILLLNLMILAGILVCSHRLITHWQQFEDGRNLGQVILELHSQLDPLTGDASVESWGDRLQHDFFVITERNLFRPERRPRAIDEAGKAPEAAPKFPREPKLTGVAEKDGERLAFLRIYESRKDEGKALKVEVGAGVQGWTVSAIADTTLTLNWNDQRVVLDMLDSEPVKPAAKRVKKAAALNIIRIGSKVAAVETSSPEPPKAVEDRGLQVGVVGGQTTGRTRGRTSLAGRGTMGRGGLAGRAGRSMGRSSQGRGLPATVGIRRFGQQVVPSQR
jgi:hypothetical protein